MFLDYSEWLFAISSNLEDRISMNNYNAQEKRVIGHIAERLFNIYIIKCQQDKQLKIKEHRQGPGINHPFPHIYYVGEG